MEYKTCPLTLNHSILAPSLDVDILKFRRAERVDERACETGVGDKRHVEVYGSTAYLVAIGKLRACEILRYVDDHVDGVVVQQVESLWLIALL